MTPRKIAAATAAKLAAPFTQNLPFLLLTWFAAAGIDLAIELHNLHWKLALLFAAYFFVANYIAVLLCTLWKPLAKVLKPIYFGILVMWNLANTYCLATYRTRLSHDFIEIIANSNPGEMREYAQMYFHWTHVAALIATLVFAIVVYRLATDPANRPHRRAWRWGAAALAAALALLMANPDFKPNELAWDFDMDQIANPALFPSHPHVEPLPDATFPQVVIILGESATPSHMSLYGYKLPTTPRLQKRARRGELTLFNHATSPGYNTGMAFKYILNTHTPQADDSVKWYRTLGLPELLQTAGYHTFWLSNQLPQGLYNNLSSAYSRMCDTAIFLRHSSKDNPYDAELLTLPVPATTDTAAVFYHLMGQHPHFTNRYPARKTLFLPTDKAYKDYNDTQALMLSRYDNATLYNDFVVDSIMNLYADRNAIVIYFSDHALDLYQTDPNYCGHATELTAAKGVGVHVPMLVYMTPQFRRLNPRAAELVDSLAAHPFNTQDIIYLVADALALKFSDNAPTSPRDVEPAVSAG